MPDDVVVPIADPKSAIGSNFRANRRGPLVVAAGKISVVVRDEIRAARLQAEQAQQMAGRLADELRAVPVFPGEIAGRAAEKSLDSLLRLWAKLSFFSKTTS